MVRFDHSFFEDRSPLIELGTFETASTKHMSASPHHPECAQIRLTSKSGKALQTQVPSLHCQYVSASRAKSVLEEPHYKAGRKIHGKQRGDRW